MKTYKNYFILILITLLVVLFLTSCPDSVLTGVNNIDEMPDNLKTVGYLNYSAAAGTVVVTDTTITVTKGSASLSDYTICALELNTSLALAAGYTIEDEYNADDEIYILTYTQTGKPTIEYEFGIYFDFDVCIEKYEGGVLNTDFSAFFSWRNDDLID
ncbi:MAG: hypothetical protein WC162_08045 [Sphaerochaetaceae bacterium]|nr:hypothetical protein [Sphaerochaetaceae bacterium]